MLYIKTKQVKFHDAETQTLLSFIFNGEAFK